MSSRRVDEAFSDNFTSSARFQGKVDEAELLFRRAMTMAETYLGISHPFYLITLNGLLGVLVDQVG